MSPSAVPPSLRNVTTSPSLVLFFHWALAGTLLSSLDAFCEPPVFEIGQTATVGCWKTWNFNGSQATLSSTNDRFAVRFRACENLTVDRALQRLVYVDPGTLLRIGIQTDNGMGKPSGTWLASDIWDPPDGQSYNVFCIFGEANLSSGQVYHLVTQPVAMAPGDSFTIFHSTAANDTRPYDGGRDDMVWLLSLNGGSWQTHSTQSNPFFILGNSQYTNGVGGPGQPYGGTIYHMALRGGSVANQCSGQRFQISNREIPAGSWIVITQGVFNVQKSGAFTNNLIWYVLDDQLQEVGRALMPNEWADGTDRAIPFETAFKLFEGRSYVLAPSFEGPRPGYHSTTGFTFKTYYPFSGATAGIGPATWGGTNACVPVQAGPGGDWSICNVDSSRLQMDLWFQLIGTVEAPPPPPPPPPPSFGPPPDANLYHRIIGVDASASSTVLELAAFLRNELENMTGLAFLLATNPPPDQGIFLLRWTNNLPARFPALQSRISALNQMTNRGPETFYRFSPGTNVLFFVGNSDDALCLALHDWLWTLGRRPFLPGPGWTERPLLRSLLEESDRLHEPAFRLRDFFGTGGFGSGVPLDPEGRIQEAWTRWKKENFFGGSISINGHAGEAFNVRHRETLEANPQMRAYDVYPTSHVPWSEIMKPDANDPSLQALWIADRVGEYNPSQFAISVEPADGGGFCVCPWCTAHDRASSQVFGLAKRVADALNDQHPGAMVSLFAYNEHAAVPADPALQTWLSDSNANVYVMAIPYAFQRTGLSGDELAAAWAAAKPNNRGIYDYWAIPDWAHCLPSESLTRCANKIRYWKSLGYDGFLAESSTSAGSVGLLWHSTGRWMFDSNDAIESVRESVYTNAFGPAARPMKRMIERWGREFLLCDLEIGRSFLDMAEARQNAATDEKFLQRIRNFASYVQYLRLFHEYRQAANRYTQGHPVRHNAANALLRHIWQIHENAMVQSYRMTRLFWYVYETGDDTFRTDWDLTNSEAAGWQSVRSNPLRPEDYDLFISNGIAAYATPPNPVPFDTPSFSTNLVPLEPNYTLDGQLTAEARYLYNPQNFVFYIRPGVTSVTFRITPHTLGNTADTARVLVYNPAGALVYSNQFGGNGVYGSNNVAFTFTVLSLTTGNYTMAVNDRNKGFTLNIERNLPFVLVGGMVTWTWPGVKSWFYVPPGLSNVTLYVPAPIPVTIRNSSGTVVAPSIGDGMGQSTYPVTEGQDGTIWSMENLTCNRPGAFPLNAPRIWSFSATGSRNGLMIPLNAPPTVDAGPDQWISAPTNWVKLAGKVTDDQLTPRPFWTCLWTRVSGPGNVVFSNALSPETGVSLSAFGTHVFRFTATDTGGLSATDEVSVVYAPFPPNTPPRVHAGTNTVLSLPNSLFLQGVIEDDGQPSPSVLTGYWSKVRGPGEVRFDPPNSPVAYVTFSKPGMYLLRLTATDGEYLSCAEQTVTVLRDYTAPTFSIGETGQFGTTETFTFNSIGQTFTSTAHLMSARFRALETAAVDRVFQRFIGVDTGTLVQIGIMGDDGNGNPDGVFLAATSPDFAPPIGDGVFWALFTNVVIIHPYRVYHVVSKPTALNPGDMFRIYSSGALQTIRPYDRAWDDDSNILLSNDGGTTWSTAGRNPYFTLGYGNTVVPGPGNAQSSTHASALVTQGGSGKALGQVFAIRSREIPTNTGVRVSRLTFQARKSNALRSLIIRLRGSDGNTLKTITLPAGQVSDAMTLFTLPFDEGGEVVLRVGERYFLTTEFAPGSTSSEYYYLLSVYGETAVQDNTWGGTTTLFPIQSAANNNWNTYNWASPTPYPGRSHYDVWFGFEGVVEALPPSRPAGMVFFLR